MPAITGNDYINRIDSLNTRIWIDGKRVTGKKSEHPAFKGVMKTQAALYDLQHATTQQESMTYTSPLSGEPVGLSFLQPKTKEELTKRRQMIQQWAKHTNGMMGRSPDYMNTVLMAFAASSDLLNGEENCFPENIHQFYAFARENDLSITHTFVDPQVNRAQFYIEENDAPIAAKVVDKNEEGLIIKGARLLATQGGITDEIMVFSAGGIQDKANGFAFAIPSNTSGLSFICRESFVLGENTFNYPLSSKYEEMDTIVVFDNVCVPWERVFYYDNLPISNRFIPASSFNAFALHQVVSRQVIKTEFILGIVQSIIKTIQIQEYQHVQEKASEIIIALETMKALLLQSEAQAKLDDSGFMRPDQTVLQIASNIFPRAYPRFVEIIQQLGTSGLMSIPSEQAFHSENSKDLEHYLQAATKNAKDRVRLFRLAWDVSMSSFGTREALYERFFFGDPIRLATKLYFNYDMTPYEKQVEDFLDSDA
ncbi:4-hydroxyphenylacetate 3-monooxygenase, oxygenase component [Virgibacillus sp. MG-45]|uniref:4-hydroxyphenylacetate 3-monooxygenase, oxygenase component n=1 Tax=Virgibacillus sp. MG-45 TaxID=3102791 RepID=UPI002ED8A5D3